MGKFNPFKGGKPKTFFGKLIGSLLGTGAVVPQAQAQAPAPPPAPEPAEVITAEAKEEKRRILGRQSGRRGRARSVIGEPATVEKKTLLGG
tara:strand:+ start:432 stop:704 length:273 start_codon:yes stop_codon:yes gene_type:complete